MNITQIIYKRFNRKSKIWRFFLENTAEVSFDVNVPKRFTKNGVWNTKKGRKRYDNKFAAIRTRLLLYRFIKSM